MAVFPGKNFLSPAALARFLLTAALLVGLDLWTKVIAFDRLAVHDSAGRLVFGERGQLVAKAPYALIPGWLEFTVTTNRGAVFGMLEGYGPAFVIVSVVAIVVLSYMFAWSENQRLYQVILGMLLAGVLGNLYDRLKFGYVRDMIKGLPQWPNLFPWIFNIADSLLCTGVGLLLIHTLMFHTEHKKPKPDGAEPDKARA